MMMHSTIERKCRGLKTAIWCLLCLGFGATDLRAQASLEATSGIQLEAGGGIQLDVQGNWLNQGNLLPGLSVVRFDGNGQQQLRNDGGSFHNITVNKPTGDVVAAGNFSVDGTFALSSGDVDLNGQVVTLSSSALLAETPGNTCKGSSGYLTTTRDLGMPTGVNVAGLGLTLSSNINLGVTEIRRGHAEQLSNSAVSILRYYDIEPANQAGLLADIVFHYDESELNGQDEADLQLFRSDDQGVSWIPVNSILDVAANTVSASGITQLSRFTLISSCQAVPSAIIYVNQNATGANNGSSWDNALTSLQAALDLPTQCGTAAEIWVAAGVYNPTRNSSGVPQGRNNTFYIKQDGIRLYGGFNGTESELSERNIAQNPTILDGYFQEGNGEAIHVYHVVIIDGASGYGPITDATVLDGFTIRNGLADGSGADSTGAGIYINGAGGSTASPTIANCRVESNTAVEGGGIYINAGAGTIESVISNCNFFQNTGTGKGGAISINGASSISCDPLLDGCTFSQNTAGEGGAMYITGNTGPTINYCTFNDNTANLGGAVRNNGKLGNLTPIFITCDFLNNHATSAGGAVNNFSANGVCNTTFTDCIFRENSAADPGGAIMIDGDLGDAKSTFTNCLFERNGEDHIAYNDGNAGQQPEFLNCTFYGVDNTAIHFTHFDSGRTPIVATNCIFWNNVSLAGGTNTGDNDGDVFTNLTIQSSIVGDDIAGVYDGVDGNLQQDPTFADAANSNFYLEDCSPALDAGDNLAVSGVSTDLVGVDRILNGTVDMGALENQRLETLPALGGPIPPGTFITGLDTIRTEGPTEIGAGSSTVFEARKLVSLQPGFHAGAGTIFIARINPDSCEVVPAAREENPVAEQEIVSQPAGQEEGTLVIGDELSLVAYPNPFQRSTTLRFWLPAAGRVRLEVFNLQGLRIRTIHAGVHLESGYHEFRLPSGELPAGIYLTRLQTAGQVLTVRLVCSR
ncbi:MAG: T9SS type A sorting domain-containing protein [Lewinella sp.]|nr:T9SS type A sorting domain-containing protein [Lewinella sp.]